MCSSEIKISIYIFPRWALLFQTSNPLQFLSQQVLVIPPTLTLWNFRDFPTWLGTPWKEYFRPIFPVFPILIGFLAFLQLLWSTRFECMAVIRKPSYYRLRAVSLSFLVRRPKRSRHKLPRAWLKARDVGTKREFSSRAAVLISRVSLPRACTPLTKSEEKERLLAVYLTMAPFIRRKVVPEKRGTVPAESIKASVYMRKKGLPLCPSQELITVLAHALIVEPYPSWPAWASQSVNMEKSGLAEECDLTVVKGWPG